MFESLLDFSSQSAFFGLYGAFIISIILNLLLEWTIEIDYVESPFTTNDNQYHEIAKNYNKGKRTICSAVNWIARFIKRKESPGDDDHFISLSNAF